MTDTTSKRTSGYHIATAGQKEEAPDGLTPEQKKRWDEIQSKMGLPTRTNDGNFIVVDEDGHPAAHAIFQGTAKRGKGWETEDPVGLRNASIMADALNVHADTGKTAGELAAQVERLAEFVERVGNGYYGSKESPEVARALLAETEGGRG